MPFLEILLKKFNFLRLNLKPNYYVELMSIYIKDTRFYSKYGAKLEYFYRLHGNLCYTGFGWAYLPIFYTTIICN